MKSILCSLLIILIACVISISCAQAEIAVVSDGKSTFTVVIPAKAPASVQNAAKELRKVIEIATGAKLSIRSDATEIPAPFISLGSTQQAKATGLSNKTMAEESFHIVTKDGNLYIFGIDTPDDSWTENNGKSNGTANGVYTFLEEYLDVRWLMPGELGRDVPAKSTFILENIDRKVVPVFYGMRTLSHHFYETNKSQRHNAGIWQDRMKLGGTANYDFGHNQWRGLNRVLTPGISYAESKNPTTDAIQNLYQKHPEWFAMNKEGSRPAPRSHSAKLETTNQEFVQWYADRIVTYLKSSERPSAFSLSPSDGRNYSRSPESVALYDPIPSYDPIAESRRENDFPVVSSLIAKWYYDVSKAVAKQYPQGRLSGYIYQDYIYPPQKTDVKLPDNFIPMIAPSSVYGYGLYHEPVQKYFRNVMAEWAEVISGDWYYYDLPAQMLRQSGALLRGANFPGSTGIITPTAPDLLNIIFRQLEKSRIKGSVIYGTPSGNNGALSNYLLAKLQWDPALDANEVQKEWLYRAYGLEAGAIMETLYAKLDGWYRAYFLQNPTLRYELTPGVLRDIYGVHYPEMEQLFLKAKSRQMTDTQRERLLLIEKELIVLQWRLHKLRHLPDDFVSPLRYTDAQISDLIAAGDEHEEFALFPGVTNTGAWSGRFSKARPLPWKVAVEPVDVTSKKSLPKWNESQILIYAATDGVIKIATRNVEHSAYFAAYEIKNQEGEIVTTGIFNTEKPIVISARAGEIYTLNTPMRDPVRFHVQVQGASVATGDFRDSTLYLSAEKSAPVYVFYVGGNKFMGISEEDNSVNIRKPDSSLIAQRYVSSRFNEVRLNGFDEGWLFSPDPKNDGIQRGVLLAGYDDNSWSPISPYAQWQLQQPLEDEYHGPAWYRLKFNAPELKEDEKAQLYFGAVDGNTEVYLNGKKIKEHLLGEDYSGWDKAFVADATSTIQTGENMLAVKVTSKPVGSSGITGGVALITGKRK